MKVIYKCKNGDTDVILFDDGTREMDNHLENEPFHLEWPVSIDLNISNYCERGCPFCYQNCTKQGKSADLNVIKKKLLHPYMEVAININMGYNIDEDFIDFLQFCKDNHIIVNATINQDDIMQRKEQIVSLQNDGLLHGIGISLTKISKEELEFFKDIKNVVFHVIAGLVSIDDLELLISKFSVLILGYKQKGRAENTELPDMTLLKEWLKNNIGFNENVLCFDNLAIKQLGVRELLSDEEWAMLYQGDEGTISMYVNGVDMKFACNSFTKNNYDIGDYNIQQMFDIVRKEAHNG